MGVQGFIGGCVLLNHIISERTRVGCTVIGLFHAYSVILSSMNVICGRRFGHLSLVLFNLDESRVSLIRNCTLLDGEGVIIAGCVRRPFRFP